MMATSGDLRAVLFAEIAAFTKADAHGAKVSGRDQGVLREVEVVGRGMFQVEANAALVAQRKMAGGRNRGHSRQAREP